MENSLIAGAQCFFSCREENADGRFIFGKSTGNQRIEAWQLYLKKTFIGDWKSYFKDFIDEGIFDTYDPSQTQCIRFYFCGYLQDKLDDVTAQWNQHRICKSRSAEASGGRPNVIFFLPYLTDSEDQKKAINREHYHWAVEYAKEPPQYGCTDSFSKLAIIMMQENNLAMSKSLQDAETLYTTLVTLTEQA